MFFCITFFVLCSALVAQRTIEKTVTGTSLTTIKIDASNCFAVKIRTHASPKIIVETSLEGEYREDIVVSAIEEEESLVIRADFRPLYNAFNDKLSAHKVVSIYLNVLVPDNFKVAILGTVAKTDVSGKMKDLKIVLGSGDCTLKEFKGMAFISTFKGDIFLETEAAVVESDSKYGTVKKQVINSGTSKIKLKSISGDIFITKPK